MNYEISDKKISIPAGVFAGKNVDFCSRLLLENVEILPGEKLCDLGAGSGVVGIFHGEKCAEVTFLEANLRAKKSCEKNVKNAGLAGKSRVILSDIFEEFDRDFPGENFSLILTNPPTQGGKKLVEDFVAGAAAHLAPGGRFFLACHARMPFEKITETFFGAAKVVRRSARAKLIFAEKK